MMLPLPSLIRRAGSAALVLIVLNLFRASRGLFYFFFLLALLSSLLGSSRDNNHSLLLLLSFFFFAFFFNLLLSATTACLLNNLNSLLDSLLSRSTLGYIRGLNFCGIMPDIGVVLACATVGGFLFFALSTSLGLSLSAPTANLRYYLRSILLFFLLALLCSGLRCLHYNNRLLSCLL